MRIDCWSGSLFPDGPVGGVVFWAMGRAAITGALTGEKRGCEVTDALGDAERGHDASGALTDEEGGWEATGALTDEEEGRGSSSMASI